MAEDGTASGSALKWLWRHFSYEVAARFLLFLCMLALSPFVVPERLQIYSYGLFAAVWIWYLWRKRRL